MSIQLDSMQTETLREILQSALKELRIESARADTHEFRERLHRRERAVEAILAQLSTETVARAG